MGADVVDLQGSHPRAAQVGNAYSLSLFVSGKPIAKARPRVNRSTGRAYTPETTVTWEQSVGWQVREQLTRISIEQGLRLPLPFQGRVVIDMRFNFVKPRGTPKRVQHKLKKPDYDNLAKGVTDALQTVGLYRDDAQVTDATVRKRFADEAHPEGVEIEVTAWAE